MRRSVLLGGGALVAAFVLTGYGVPTGPAAAPTRSRIVDVCISAHPGIHLPRGIARGSDGALWFTEPGNSIGRITTRGAVGIYTHAGIYHPEGIAAGRTAPCGSRISSDRRSGGSRPGAPSASTTTGASSILRGSRPARTAPSGSPTATAAGQSGGSRPGAPSASTNFRASVTRKGSQPPRMARSGSPTVTARLRSGGSRPRELSAPTPIRGSASGGDRGQTGRCPFWFANSDDSDSIGRITTRGAVSIYTHPGIDHPWGIAAGSDGALWFTNPVGNSIGRITTEGVVTIYTHPGIRGPQGIAAGPDGALWFTNHCGGSIGRITTRGTVTIFGG